MLNAAPTEAELRVLLGEPLYGVWASLCALIEEKYDMDRLWDSGGKAWTYEYKYRRGGKTLCSLYAREGRMGFLVIFGKKEREKFEAERECYSEQIRKVYETSTTYHDGKWMLFEPADTSLFSDFINLLAKKRRPNKKQGE